MRYISDTRLMRTILYGAFISKIGHHISVLLVNLDFTMPIKLHSRTVAAGIRTSNLPRAKDFKQQIQRRVLFSKEKLNLQQIYTILYCPVLKKNKSFINKHLCYQNYYSIPVTCRYMAEILHKRRIQSINQSTYNPSILCPSGCKQCSYVLPCNRGTCITFAVVFKINQKLNHACFEYGYVFFTVSCKIYVN